jgi:small subunit ribosomal protein S1
LKAQNRIIKLLKGKRKVDGDRNHTNVSEDQILEGEVVRVVEEAAFVDIGTEQDAVISRKDLDQLDRTQMEKIRQGDTIEVRIKHLPKNGGNPLVSAAVLDVSQESSAPSEDDIWRHIEDTYQVGDVVQGTVKNIKNYGAFVELPVGIDGLVHVSEMQPGFTQSPWEVVSTGEQVRVRILEIEPDKQRIGLSLKDVAKE